MGMYVEKALALQKNGYNCSQAVGCAFCDVLNVDEDMMFHFMEGYGLGMGCTRGMCGALTAAIGVASLKVSREHAEDPRRKTITYQVSKELVDAFESKNQAVLCKDLKGLETGVVLRSCSGCVEDAVTLLEEKVFSR